VTKALILAAVVWPMLLTGGAGARIHNPASAFASVIYAAAGVVCHQKPERSFHTAGVKWPVCGRCSGLYLAAPIGAVAAVLGRRRFQRRRDLTWLAAAATPSLMTFAIERAGIANISSLTRFLAALPLGAAIAWVIVLTARESPQPIE